MTCLCEGFTILVSNERAPPFALLVYTLWSLFQRQGHRSLKHNLQTLPDQVYEIRVYANYTSTAGTKKELSSGREGQLMRWADAAFWLSFIWYLSEEMVYED